nr:MAG TPA: hypothetical protein [Siphoviridae sp. ctD5s5]
MTENRVKERGLFDLTDVSDIPDEISTNLKCNVFAQNILTLFDKAGRNLTIDEIAVGYYRQFNVIKTKRQITAKLYNMARAKNAKIRSIPNHKGVYGVIK